MISTIHIIHSGGVSLLKCNQYMKSVKKVTNYFSQIADFHLFDLGQFSHLHLRSFLVFELL